MLTAQTNKEVIILLLLSQILPMLGHAGNIMLYIIIAILYIRQRNKVVLWKTRMLWLPLSVSFFIGLLIQGYGAYFIFKDIFYLISPIMILMFGEVLVPMIKPNQLLKTVVIFGSLWALVYCVLNIGANGMLIVTDPRAVKNSENAVFIINSFWLIASSVLIANLLYGKYRIVKFGNWLILINLLAIYLSGSRTFLVAFFSMLVLTAYPKIKEHKRLLIPLILFSFLFYAYIQVSQSQLASSFLNVRSEMTNTDFDELSEVNDNYRAYEAFVALSQISQAPTYQQVLGMGLGSYVDLRGLFDPLDIEKVPILHNGYPYILLKMGYFGMIVFIGFFISLFIHFWKRKKIGSEDYSLWPLLCCGAIFSLLIMNSSVTAIFNSGYNSILIIVGYALKCSRTNQNFV